MTETVNNETEQVNKEEQPANVEIVTKEPTPVNPAVSKKKDPKKIEAGKKLAAYNKKAKQSKAALKEKNFEKPVDDEVINQGGPGFDITLTTVVAIIGLGLTGVNLYLTHIQKNEKRKDYKPTTPNLNEKNPVDNDIKDSKNIKANKGIKRVRFEPGMA